MRHIDDGDFSGMACLAFLQLAATELPIERVERVVAFTVSRTVIRVVEYIVSAKLPRTTLPLSSITLSSRNSIHLPALQTRNRIAERAENENEVTFPECEQGRVALRVVL